MAQGRARPRYVVPMNIKKSFSVLFLLAVLVSTAFSQFPPAESDDSLIFIYESPSCNIEVNRKTGEISSFKIIGEKFSQDMCVGFMESKEGKPVDVSGFNTDFKPTLLNDFSSEGSGNSIDFKGKMENGLLVNYAYSFSGDNNLVIAKFRFSNQTENDIEVKSPLKLISYAPGIPEHNRFMAVLLSGEYKETAKEGSHTLSVPGESPESVSPGNEVMDFAPSGNSEVFDYIAYRDQYYVVAFSARGESKGIKFFTRKIDGKYRSNGADQSGYGYELGMSFLPHTFTKGEEKEVEVQIYCGEKREKNLTSAGLTRLFDTWDGMTGGIRKIF